MACGQRPLSLEGELDQELNPSQVATHGQTR